MLDSILSWNQICPFYRFSFQKFQKILFPVKSLVMLAKFLMEMFRIVHNLVVLEISDIM